MDKIITRNCAKFIRSKLNMWTISKTLIAQIRTLEEYQNAQNVMLYYPKDDEPDLRALTDDNKNFYLPRIEKGILVSCPWQADDELELSTFNVYEPKTNAISPKELDLIITPGLCADINKNRLGYGKGCYDEFLPHCNAVVIFPIPDELLFNSIPSEPHDIKPHIIVTPTKIIK